MRILVLGATGMLGHRLLLDLAETFDVVGAVRGAADAWSDHPMLRGRHLVGGIDALAPETVSPLLKAVRPDVVLNCVGIVKQADAAKSPIQSIAINALFPHVLAERAADVGARVIHFGTDCVFSGRQGPYRETDVPDATDLYGRTKLLGELIEANALTLRSSIIGHEIRGGLGLVEWFLSRRGGRVSGYARVLFTGVTTNEMAQIVRRLLLEQPAMRGLWQVAAIPIDKFSLLTEINAIYRLAVTIDRDDTVHCDRRLDGRRFTSATGIVIPTWRDMIKAMHDAQHKTNLNYGV